ncbi:hypothetical protein HK405_007534, partial [Cladochytrium tenue]
IVEAFDDEVVDSRHGPVYDDGSFHQEVIRRRGIYEDDAAGYQRVAQSPMIRDYADEEGGGVDDRDYDDAVMIYEEYLNANRGEDTHRNAEPANGHVEEDETGGVADHDQNFNEPDGNVFIEIELPPTREESPVAHPDETDRPREIAVDSGNKKSEAKKDKGKAPVKPSSKVVKATSRKRAAAEASTALVLHDDSGMRASKRHRIRPLEYWRGERMKISFTKTSDGQGMVPDVKDVIIVPKLVDDVMVSKKHRKKQIHRAAELVPIEHVAPLYSPNVVAVNYATGEEEELRKVRVHLHKTIFEIGTGAVFFVPRGNQYSILNLSSRESRLLFMQARELDETGDKKAKTAAAPPPNADGPSVRGRGRASEKIARVAAASAGAGDASAAPQEEESEVEASDYEDGSDAAPAQRAANKAGKGRTAAAAPKNGTKEVLKATGKKAAQKEAGADGGGGSASR